MKLVYPQIVTGADLLRGINKLNYTAPLLARRGAVAASIVNSSMVGVPSFYKVMKKYEIQPVIGLSVSIDLDDTFVKAYIYAQNEAGYENLLKMSSAIAITDDETIPLKWFQAYCMHCIIILPLTHESWGIEYTQQKIEKISKSMSPSSQIFIGISRPFGKRHEKEETFIELANEVGLKVTAVYEARYTMSEDAAAYTVAQAIRHGEKIDEQMEATNKLEQYTHIPDQEELLQWFEGREEWLAQTAELMLECRLQLPTPERQMPNYPIPTEMTADRYLAEKCIAGLRTRLGNVTEVYERRLQYELNIIQEMKFADYFLIVEDFMRFAKEQQILTGPGRGSSAGSLVAYSLFITDVDPIEHGLIFERFLNPERVTMPDIDIDFADHRRMEVVHYVGQKYGKDFVAQIGTFGTLTAKAVARNVGRVYHFTSEDMRRVSQMIGDTLGITLEQVYATNHAFRQWVLEDTKHKEWYDACLRLEGLPRNTSVHAAGIVLAPKPLVNYVPLQKGEEQLYVTQWPMGDVEAQGLLKIDLLGLRNLTILERIRSMIAYEERKTIDFDRIPLTDKKTFELFKRGETTGVFQFESAGMRDTLRLIQPETFEELYAINALYRPGPMEHIPSYANRKQGKERIHDLHPMLQPILQETFGIIVYQEQIIQILVQLAHYSLGEADLVRRAISKKNHQILQQERSKFIERATENGLNNDVARHIFELIVKFADYGFPKSHAVAYSLISYRLAYLKAHFPVYFYAALLSSVAGNEEKTAALLAEARAHQIEVLKPSIHYSKFEHTVENGAIRLGIRAIKGVPSNFYQRLKAVRMKREWSSLFEFAEAIGEAQFTEKTIIPLVKAGALDDFGQHRGILLASIPAAVDHVNYIGTDHEDEEDAFRDILRSATSPKYADSEPIPKLEQLAFEKDVLGFYVSDHPAFEWKRQLGKSFRHIASIDQMPAKMSVNIIGLIVEMKKIRTKKGEPMAFVKVQDETGVISCTIFPKQFAQYHSFLEEKAIISVMGTVEIRQHQHQILVKQMEQHQ